MPIRVQCPQCGKEYNVGDDKAGRRFQCKGCQFSVVVPVPAAAEDDDPFAGMDDFSEDYTSPSPKPAGAKNSTSGKGGAKGKGNKKGKSVSSGGLPLGAWIGIGVAAVAAIAVGVFLMMRGGDDDEGNGAGNNTVAGGSAGAGAPAIESVEDLEGARENLETIVHAMYEYERRWQTFPVSPQVPDSHDSEEKSYLSWRVHLLPFLDQQALYDQFHLNEPWDSPHNAALTNQMPDVFKSPGDAAGVTTTRYLTFVGPGTAYEDEGPRLQDIRDRTSDTILLAQVPASKAVPWTKPEDAVFDPANPFSCIGAIPPRGMPIAWADAATSFLSPTTDAAAFASFIGRDDGQTTDESLILRQPIAGEVSIAAVPANPPTGDGGSAATTGPSGSASTTASTAPAHTPTLAELNATMLQLKQIVLGMHNYHDTFFTLPVNPNAAAALGPDGQPFLSWRVHLLPFVDQQNLYQQFHLNEPWDSPHNLPLADLMPDIYKSPSDEPAATTTRFVVFSGPNAPFDGGIGKRFSDFIDGLSNTILIAQVPADHAVPWTKPEDAVFDATDPLACIGAIPPEGLPIALADGACFFLSPEADATSFANYVQHADSQVIAGDLLLSKPANYVPFEPPSTPPTGPLHLAYMTDDCIGLVHIAPQHLLEAEWLMASLPPEATAGAPVPLESLEEALFWIVPRADANVPSEPDTQFALSFSQPTSAAELPLSQMYQGNAYMHANDTIVFAIDDRFERMFQGTSGASPLAGSLRSEQLDADVYIAVQLKSESFSVDWSEAELMLAPAGELGNGLMQAQQVQLAFRANESPLLKVWLTFPDDATATSYKTALEQQLPQMLDLQKSDPIAGPLATLLADAWSVSQEAGSVSLEIAHSDALTAELASMISALMTPAVMINRDITSRQQSENNLSQILIASHNYHDVFNSFPVPTANEQYFDEDGKPFLSWRVHLLPYLDEVELYQEFRFDEPWDSEHNIQLLERMPAVFEVNDAYLADLDPGMTRIVRADGEGTLFQNGAGSRIQNVTDGTSNTAYCFAVGPEHAVPWTKPEDIVIDFMQPIWPQLAVPEGEEFLVGFCDGAVRHLPTTIDEDNLRRLLLHNDNEVLELP